MVSPPFLATWRAWARRGSRLRPQVGVGGGLLQRLAHAHEDARVDVSGALAKVGGHAPLYLRDVEQAPLVVDLLHKPDVSRDGDLLAWWGRGAEGADLLRVAADGVLHALLEDGIELVIVCDPLAGEAHDEAASLRGLHVVMRQEVTQQHTKVVGAYAVEGREREHARGQLWGRELALGGQNGQGLVAEQAVGQAVQACGLHPVLLAVELHEGNALQELPREGSPG